jgi:hypothetical protein
MKTSILEQNGILPSVVELVKRTVDEVQWPARRRVMGDVTMTLLDGKARAAESVFGWARKTVELGLNEFRTGITCVNDVSKRRKLRTEEKYPRMLKDIRDGMDAASQAQSHLRTRFSYTKMTAKAVRSTLLEKGWTEREVPGVRTLSNILNRQDYRLRRAAKTRVQKNDGD